MNKEPVPSFEDVAAELGQPLAAYLQRMTGNSADADDLLQETLMRIAAGLSQFERRSSVKTWAFKIATNVAIDFLRRAKRSTVFEFTDDDDSPVDEEDPLILDEMNRRAVLFAMLVASQGPMEGEVTEKSVSGKEATVEVKDYAKPITLVKEGPNWRIKWLFGVKQ